jgi:hypothetical protein
MRINKGEKLIFDSVDKGEPIHIPEQSSVRDKYF